MKQRSILLCAAVLAAVTACKTDEDGIVLGTPVLSIANTTSTSFTVAWEAVENADMYTYEFREEQASTESLSVTFDGLTPDSMYAVRVKAVSTSASVESDWAEISVTLLSQEAETPKLNLVAEMSRFPAPCMRMPAMSRRQCCRICWLHICNITVMRRRPLPSLQ